MIDLTKIETPLGLLDRETFDALKKHGGPYEVYLNDGTWQEYEIKDGFFNLLSRVFRVKSIPPKPREWWMTDPRPGFMSWCFRTPEDALEDGQPLDRLVRVREVLE